MIRQVGGSNGKTVINVATSFDGATIAVGIAGAVGTRVLNTGLGIDSRAENPHNGPHGPLGAEGRCPVSEGHRGIQVGEFTPADCEENGVSGINLKPPVPATEVQFEHIQSLAGVQ